MTLTNEQKAAIRKAYHPTLEGDSIYSIISAIELGVSTVSTPFTVSFAIPAADSDVQILFYMPQNSALSMVSLRYELGEGATPTICIGDENNREAYMEDTDATGCLTSEEDFTEQAASIPAGAWVSININLGGEIYNFTIVLWFTPL